MPLTASSDPASGDPLDYNRTPDDGKHRSHRFLATNQMMPELLDLPGAETHLELTEQWLQGEIEVPEIAGKWASGPVVPLELVLPETAAPGEPVEVTVMFANNKAGHLFPTGPLDIIQAWIEVVVTDADGRVVYSSGTLDDEHFVEPGAFAFKGEPVDQYGNLIDQHNLWEMVGSRYSRTLFPGFSDRTTYSFTVPESLSASAGESSVRTVALQSGGPRNELHVRARLRYRKFNQAIFNALIPDTLDMETAPITTMASDEKTILVTDEPSE